MYRSGVAYFLAAACMIGATGTAKAQPIEITRDWCRGGSSIHVFARHFNVTRDQQPKGETGVSIIVKKGSSHKGWKLSNERWRWYCGDLTKAKGVFGKIVTQDAVVQGCKKALEATGAGAPLAPIVCPWSPDLVTSILGNWERTRCKDAKSVDITYQTNGRIIWRCHD